MGLEGRRKVQAQRCDSRMDFRDSAYAFKVNNRLNYAVICTVWHIRHKSGM